MKVLSLSDVTIQFIYSFQVRERFADIGLVLGCGDLPYYYQEFVLTSLNVPLYYVRGNHDKEIEYSVEEKRSGPSGGIDLHGQAIHSNGLLLAGVEGCLRYRPGPFQYTQTEMWYHVFRLVPGLLRNRLLYGRFLDIFVTHAPPRGIHDKQDLPHQGINAFRWLLKVFQPAYHFHGHIHVYRPDAVTDTRFGRTLVINTFGYRETNLQLDLVHSRPHLAKKPGF